MIIWVEKLRGRMYKEVLCLYIQNPRVCGRRPKIKKVLRYVDEFRQAETNTMEKENPFFHLSRIPTYCT